MFSRLRSEARVLIRRCVELSWFMRGGISYTELMGMTPVEREITSDFVADHMESIKKHPFPVY